MVWPEKNLTNQNDDKKFAETPKMYKTENNISLKRRSELNALMNQRLADTVDL